MSGPARAEEATLATAQTSGQATPPAAPGGESSAAPSPRARRSVAARRPAAGPSGTGTGARRAYGGRGPGGGDHTSGHGGTDGAGGGVEAGAADRERLRAEHGGGQGR
ncbi:hypothetical protein EKH77_22090 [Streptomyces luteoverticillatus]|uniref:Uncharacterized protein n=1 Tax=Streptomyces luteoverticillatus TaxID=66425 RepID=A0A3S9PMJ2_STRLT|nr:hypothetical protein [Streptomyces luteoverticillatus]AZQ73547.1 hypothetical protein EKH77_22090 [Streptomyces luteoverticillatus]